MAFQAVALAFVAVCAVLNIAMMFLIILDTRGRP